MNNAAAKVNSKALELARRIEIKFLANDVDFIKVYVEPTESNGCRVHLVEQDDPSVPDLYPAVKLDGTIEVLYNKTQDLYQFIIRGWDENGCCGEVPSWSTWSEDLVFKSIFVEG